MRRTYITVAQFSAVKTALANGDTIKDIAIATGVAHHTVLRVSRGLGVSVEHVDAPDIPEQMPEWKGVILFREFSPTKICPICGVKVKMPCLACQIRTLQKGETL